MQGRMDHRAGGWKMSRFSVDFQKSSHDMKETWPPEGHIMCYAEVGRGMGFFSTDIVLAVITLEDVETDDGWEPIKFVEFLVHGGSSHCLTDIDLYWCLSPEWDKALCDLTGQQYNPDDYTII